MKQNWGTSEEIQPQKSQKTWIFTHFLPIFDHFTPKSLDLGSKTSVWSRFDFFRKRKLISKSCTERFEITALGLEVQPRSFWKFRFFSKIVKTQKFWICGSPTELNLEKLRIYPPIRFQKSTWRWIFRSNGLFMLEIGQNYRFLNYCPKLTKNKIFKNS